MKKVLLITALIFGSTSSLLAADFKMSTQANWGYTDNLYQTENSKVADQFYEISPIARLIFKNGLHFRLSLHSENYIKEKNSDEFTGKLETSYELIFSSSFSLVPKIGIGAKKYIHQESQSSDDNYDNRGGFGKMIAAYKFDNGEFYLTPGFESLKYYTLGRTDKTAELTAGIDYDLTEKLSGNLEATISKTNSSDSYYSLASKEISAGLSWYEEKTVEIATTISFMKSDYSDRDSGEVTKVSGKQLVYSPILHRFVRPTLLRPTGQKESDSLFTYSLDAAVPIFDHWKIIVGYTFNKNDSNNDSAKYQENRYQAGVELHF